MRLATSRLVDLTFKSIHEWAQVLPALGAPCELKEGTISVSGVVRSGIGEGADPITKAVTLGFVFGGMFWPKIFPDLLKGVKKEWTRRRKGGLPMCDEPPPGALPPVVEQASLWEDTHVAE